MSMIYTVRIPLTFSLSQALFSSMGRLARWSGRCCVKKKNKKNKTKQNNAFRSDGTQLRSVSHLVYLGSLVPRAFPARRSAPHIKRNSKSRQRIHARVSMRWWFRPAASPPLVGGESTSADRTLSGRPRGRSLRHHLSPGFQRFLALGDLGPPLRPWFWPQSPRARDLWKPGHQFSGRVKNDWPIGTNSLEEWFIQSLLLSVQKWKNENEKFSRQSLGRHTSRTGCLAWADEQYWDGVGYLPHGSLSTHRKPNHAVRVQRKKKTF